MTATKSVAVITVQPLNWEVVVVKGRQNFVDEVRDLYQIDMTEDVRGCDGYAGSLRSPRGDLGLVMMLPARRSEKIVWHEAMHMMHFVMDAAGMPITEENTEMQAYMQGHIVQEIDKALYKRELR